MTCGPQTDSQFSKSFLNKKLKLQFFPKENENQDFGIFFYRRLIITFYIVSLCCSSCVYLGCVSKVLFEINLVFKDPVLSLVFYKLIYEKTSLWCLEVLSFYELVLVREG